MEVGGARRIGNVRARQDQGVGGLGEEERRIAVVAAHFAAVGSVVAADAEDAPHREGAGLPLHGRDHKGRRGQDIGAHEAALRPPAGDVNPCRRGRERHCFAGGGVDAYGQWA